MKRLIAITALGISASAMLADNPIVQTWFTGDPAPMVSGDRFYVYTGHDEDGADFFWMNEWRVYSSDDMVNWVDHGSPLDLSDFDWADDRAWAAQTVERDGKYYWYICAHSTLTGGMAIGVAVSDSPTGPFKDAIGKPLFDDSKWDNIDPSVFIDDDGQAYICWGNPTIHMARLNDDMISFKDEPVLVEQTIEGFCAPMFRDREKDVEYKDCYTEGPWLSKRAGKYQLLYAAGGIPEHISYSEAESPFGPWKYMGEIMPLQDTGSFTNHCGAADYKGHSYFVYHTGKLPKGGGFGRSTAIEEFVYNPDGTFPTIMATDEGCAPIAKFNPYRKVEGETMAYSSGVKTENNDKTGVFVSDIHNGDWIKLRNVDLADGAKSFTVRAASALQGGSIELRTDSIEGEIIAKVNIPHTGGWEEWQTITCDEISPATGTHDIFLVFKGNKGPKLFNLDWWELGNLH